MLVMAIEKAGSIDSAKVREVYVNGEFKGTTQGDMKFNEGFCRLSHGASFANPGREAFSSLQGPRISCAFT
jgi:hypothetical protein